MSGQLIVPVYIVCDESKSANGETIASINDFIRQLFRLIAGDPVVDVWLRVGIIAFNDSPKVLLPLTQLTNVQQIPSCVASGQAHFGPVFHLLRSEIEKEFVQFRSIEGLRVYRPVIFFLSTGNPVDEGWRAQWNDLVDPSFPFRPHIIGFCVGSSNLEVLGEVSTVIESADYQSLRNSDRTDPVGTMKNFLRGLIGFQIFEQDAIREHPIT